MKKATLNITGIIGVPQEGDDRAHTDLVNVTTQWEKIRKDNPDLENLVIKINSPGGNIAKGETMIDFLEAIKKDNNIKLTTISNGMVGSMATMIFMVGEERLVRKGDEFFIHNPQGKPEGDSKFIEAYLEEMKVVETEMVQKYTSSTGAEEAAIQLLMDEATHLDPQDVVKMGFATDQAPEVETTMVMLFDPEDFKKEDKSNKSNKSNIMKFKEQLAAEMKTFKEGLFAELGIKPKSEEEKAHATKLEAIKKSHPEVEDFHEIKIGEDTVMILVGVEGEKVGAGALKMVDEKLVALEDGDFTLEDEKVMVIAEGKISEVKDPVDEMAALKAQNLKLENELKAEQEKKAIDPEKLDAMIQEKMKGIEEKAESMDETKEELEALQSHYKVPKNKSFRREPGELSLKERLAAQKETYNPTKSTAQRAKESMGQ